MAHLLLIHEVWARAFSKQLQPHFPTPPVKTSPWGWHARRRELLSDKNEKRQQSPEMPRDKEIPCNHGDAQTCRRWTASRTRWGCHRGPRPARDPPPQSHLLRHFMRSNVILHPGKKKFEKCFAKYTFFLKVVLARRRKTQCQQDLDMATAHPCKWEADLSLFTHLTRTSLTYFLAYVLREQIHVTMHFEGIDRNINLFSLSEKNEHWQHMFTVFYCKKKKEKTTTPNFKYLFCRRPVLLWNNIALWTTNM